MAAAALHPVGTDTRLVGAGSLPERTSLADNIVHGDTNGRRDIFVAWLRRDTTLDRADLGRH